MFKHCSNRIKMHNIHRLKQLTGWCSRGVKPLRKSYVRYALKAWQALLSIASGETKGTWNNLYNPEGLNTTRSFFSPKYIIFVSSSLKLTTEVEAWTMAWCKMSRVICMVQNNNLIVKVNVAWKYQKCTKMKDLPESSKRSLLANKRY